MPLEDFENEIQWCDFLTPQEHKMTGFDPKRFYGERWYTPIAIQKGFGEDFVKYVRQRYSTFMLADAILCTVMVKK